MARIGQLTLAELGGHCLAYLAEHPSELAEFMVATGYTPDGVRRAAASGAIHAGLVDYVGQNESLLLAICADRKIAPESFMVALQRLAHGG